ncbi:MAG: hypothetical protein AUJ75_01300 [Candidatus Omnitrophica bacterium CG1_02_49_10]|nr:MAG: hypothetical protein AUJ75_01300 [Candidatus Omnitrophica bacterium CG1_02_49_10]
MKVAPAFIAAAIGIAFTSTAYAASPIKTVDTGTTEKGAFAISSGLEFADAKGSDEFAGLTGEIAYGVSDNVDMSLKGVYLYRDAGASKDAWGGGDPSFEGKFRFIDEGDSPISVGLISAVKLPSGDKEKGLGNEKTDFLALIIMSKSFDKWTVSANLGLCIVGDADKTDSQNEGEIYSIAARYKLTDALDVMGEFYAENGAHIRYGHYQYLELDKAVGLGVSYDITNSISLNAGGIADLNDKNDDVGFNISVDFKI